MKIAGRSRFPFAAILVLAVSTWIHAPASAHPDGSFPRTFNLDWRNDPDALRDARYDIVSLSTRAQRADFDSIRMLNPASVRLVSPTWYTYYYAGPSGFPQTIGPYDPNDPWYGFDRKYWDLMNDNNWWCWGVDSLGTSWHATAFWQMWLGNFSSKCPRNAQGKRLCDVWADFVLDELVLPKGADGLFFDQFWTNPAWLHWHMGGCNPASTNCAEQTPGTYWNCGFDMDANGQPDNVDSLKVWWQEGINVVLTRLRTRMGPSFVIAGNGWTGYPLANGAMIERFPRIHGMLDPDPNPWGYRWFDEMFSNHSGYLTVYPSFFTAPSRTFLDVELGGGDRYQFPQTGTSAMLKRFAFGSALLGDGYIGLNSGYYGCNYWEPEYDLRLGWPRGPAYEVTIDGIDIWRRDYTSGEVWVNPRSVPLAEGADHPAVGAWDAVIRQIGDGGGGIPNTAILERNQPNPFHDTGTNLFFTLRVGERANLDIVDLRGRRVRGLWQGEGTGAIQVAPWDGRSDEGWPTPAGVYFAVLEGENGSTQQKLVRVSR